MEFPVTLPSSPDWRRAALAAAVLAAVELVVLVILAVSVFGLPFAEERRREALASSGAQTGHRDSGVTSADSGRKGVPTPRQTRSETSVVVLNGNGITGAADLAAAPVRKQQYILTATGNAPRSDFRRTLVMYRPGFEGEAHRLARDVGAERVAPLDGLRGADLLGAQLALIVGRK